MLRLESIELHGFKSFADRTRLEFPHGITCIVGPNGCGKSNIADAVAWVLGEQSAKSLRGDRMDDVIFGGSNGRKPNPYAEVTMNWVRLEALEKEDENRLVISRRLAKNGFSEYTMNQAPCRLKDVQSALMDFGMGTRAYTIVQQGKIAHILNAKPLERRSLIEEAAGILKYKVRRNESELKLKTAEENLLRINDIIREVQKRRGQLNRQVGKARRYKKLKERLREVEKTLLSAEIYRQSNTLREVIAAFEKTRRREMTVNTDISQRDAQVTSLRKDQLIQEKALRQQENALNATTQEISLAEEHSKFKHERIVERETQLAQLDQDRKTGQKEQRDLLAKLAKREKDLRNIDSRLQKAGSKVQDAEKDEALLAQNASHELDELEKCRRVHEQHKANRLGLDVEIQQMARQRQQIDFQKAATEQRIYSLNKESDALVKNLEKNGSSIVASEAKMTHTKSQIIDIQETWSQQKSQSDQLQQNRDHIGRELQRLEDKIESLKEIMKARLGVGDATKTLLQRTNKSLTLLRDVLDSNHAFDKALDWILEPLGDAILITSDEDEAELDQFGHDLEIQSLDLRHEIKGASAEPFAGVVPALDQVIADPRLKGALIPILGNTFIVSKDDDMKQMALDFPMYCLVDIKGNKMVRGVWTTNRGSESAHTGFLTLKGDIERTEQERAETQLRWQGIQKDYQAIQAKLEETDRDLQSKRNQCTELEKDILVGRQQLENLKNLRQALEANLESEKSRSQDMESQIAQFAKRETELAGKAKDLDVQKAKSNAALQKQEKVVRRTQEKIRDMTAALVKLREKHAADQTLAARIQAEHEHLASLKQTIAKRQEQGEAQRLQLEADVRKMKSEIKELKTKIEKDLIIRDAAKAELQKQETVIQKILGNAERLDGEIKELHGRRDDLRAQEGRYELENARISSKIAHLQEKYQANVGAPCVVEDIDPTALPDKDTMAQMDAEHTQMQERLNSMGAVNLLAIEEFDEVDERYTFLINQQKDLLDSITEIRSTINKLNKISSEKFIDAFLEINKRFSESFRQLFGGGRAQMALVDEENILETGVDLLVKPPGKKLQNVSLMSGGEKALTAIALLMAIFEFRPSPFCIFDEVDAPLDEANIMRFLRKLEDLKTRTQFILITHQKSTMAAASSLFGVTMEDGGCSKLVSVAFD